MPFPASLREVHTTKPRVLIVDDEHLIADTLVSIFALSGYQARAAYSAEEALKIIPTWRPDLAVLDVILPKMNGIDLAILLRRECPDCRVSLFSGAAATSDLLAAAPYTFEVLAKPVPPRDMLANARRLLSSSAKRI